MGSVPPELLAPPPHEAQQGDAACDPGRALAGHQVCQRLVRGLPASRRGDTFLLFTGPFLGLCCRDPMRVLARGSLSSVLGS